MPLYEYECARCQHRFEQIQKFSDPPVEKCPKCGGRVSQLLYPPAIQFKGSGWYVTDYAHKNASGHSPSGNGNGSKSDSKPGETKSAETKAADTKPATSDRK